MLEFALTLGAILAVCSAWLLYQRYRGPGPLRERMATISNPAALPPATAVPVDSALVRKLYATRAWSETQPLLAEDFAMVLPDGRRVGAQALEESTAMMEHWYVDPRATVEEIFADLEFPSVLYVRDVARLQPVRGEAFEAMAWTRLVVAPCGTRIRELGPSSVTVT